MSALSISLDLQSLVGVPYRHGSTDPTVGLDCLTCAAEVYRRRGWVFPLPASYGVDNIPAELFLDWEAHWTPCEPEDFALVDMRPSHCGVLLSGDRVIHCRAQDGVVIQRLDVVRRFMLGTWRLRGL